MLPSPTAHRASNHPTTELTCSHQLRAIKHRKLRRFLYRADTKELAGRSPHCHFSRFGARQVLHLEWRTAVAYRIWTLIGQSGRCSSANDSSFNFTGRAHRRRRREEFSSNLCKINSVYYTGSNLRPKTLLMGKTKPEEVGVAAYNVLLIAWLAKSHLGWQGLLFIETIHLGGGVALGPLDCRWVALEDVISLVEPQAR